MSDAPLAVLTDPARADRFWSNVAMGLADECWLWQRAANGSGYGVHRSGINGVSYTTMAHRVAWVLAVGQSIPDGMEIDHTCSVRLCCNPAHLDVVDRRENVARSLKQSLATRAAVESVGPASIHLRRQARGDRHLVTWRERLVDGRTVQRGQVFETREDAEMLKTLLSPSTDDPVSTGLNGSERT